MNSLSLYTHTHTHIRSHTKYSIHRKFRRAIATPNPRLIDSPPPQAPFLPPARKKNAAKTAALEILIKKSDKFPERACVIYRNNRRTSPSLQLYIYLCGWVRSRGQYSRGQLSRELCAATFARARASAAVDEYKRQAKRKTGFMRFAARESAGVA